MNDEKNVHTEEAPVERDLREIGEADICVSCGAPVPEGRQVSPKCEEKSGASRVSPRLGHDADLTLTPECHSTPHRRCATSPPTDEIRREIDIFNLLPAEAVADANRLGFEFLAERGYDAIGAWEDEAKCATLERELAERGEELRYSGAYDLDDQTGKLKAILIWYGVYDREGRCLARSKGLKLVPTENTEITDEK